MGGFSTTQESGGGTEGISSTSGEVAVNDDSGDVDFRVESNNSTHMLFVDGGGDTVGVGCTPAEAASNNPSALLMVSNRGTPSTPAEYSPLIVENDAAAAYVNVISNDNGWQGIIFGDQTDPDEAGIKYNSNNKRMYLTGNAEAIASNVLTIDHSANTVGVNVGAPAAGALDVDGAVALKAQSSAPSATADYGKLYATNDDDGSTVLLCHFEGSDAATSGDGFLDSSATSAHTLTVVGTAQIDTAQYKWGSSSLLLDGNSDRINVSDSTDFDWDGEFTVEAWVRFNSLSGWQQVVNSATANTSFFRLAWKGATNEWALAVMNTAFYLSDSLSTDTWYHVALTRDGSNVCRFYRDGVHKGNSTISGTVANTGGLTIGAYSHLSADQEWLNGWIDEVRIKKGSAIYTGTGSFTPPTGPLLGTTSELYAQDSAGNATKISPHNAQGEWEYFSQNSITKKTVRINMEEVVRDLGKLTGKDYIKDE